MSAILVTGAAGYIGSQALRVFAELGRPLIALDDFSTGNRWAIPPEISVFEGDFVDHELLSAIQAKIPFDTIIHFAAKTSVAESVSRPELYERENFEKTRRLGEIAQSFGVRSFIFSSTCAVYGATERARVSEATPTRPDSPYGSTKLAAERALFSMPPSSRMKVSALRYFNVAGASPEEDLGQANEKVQSLVSLCAEAAAGKRSEIVVHGTDYPTLDGTGVRDYIHVVDLARAHLDVLRWLEQDGNSEIFNCGYGRPFSVREVITAMEAVSGKKISVRSGPRRTGDIPAIYADSSKIRRLTDWSPKYDDLREICRSAYVWELKRPRT